MREELRREAKLLWAYAKLYPDDSKTRIPYRIFKAKVRDDWRFRELAEAEAANAENIFQRNHFERTLERVGLDDLEVRLGRPKGRKSAAKRPRQFRLHPDKSNLKSPSERPHQFQRPRGKVAKK